MTERADFTAYRLPALAVPCPECKRGVGRNCVRPSEHEIFGGEFHAARGREADRVFIEQHGEDAGLYLEDGQWHIDPQGYKDWRERQGRAA